MALLGRDKEAAPLAFEGSALFDRREQLEKMEGVLLEGEQVLACLDMKGGGTGFLGLTDKRVIVYDKAFLAKMKAIVSVPYREIVTVAAADDDRLGRGFFGSSVLTVAARNGQTYTFEFRSSEKAHAVHTMLLERIL
jgi:Bacterial PH domain